MSMSRRTAAVTVSKLPNLAVRVRPGRSGIRLPAVGRAGCGTSRDFATRRLGKQLQRWLTQFLAEYKTLRWTSAVGNGHDNQFSRPASSSCAYVGRCCRAGSWRPSADRSTEYAQVVAAGDLARLVGGEAAAQHRRDEVHPPRVILKATPRIELVGADADVIDADDLGHLLEAVDVSIDARVKVPDADRAAGPGDCKRVAGADLPAAERRRPHRPRSQHGGVRQQQRLRRDLDRLLRHVLGRVGDIADEAEPIAGADHFGPEFSQPIMGDGARLEIADVVGRVMHE